MFYKKIFKKTSKEDVSNTINVLGDNTFDDKVRLWLYVKALKDNYKPDFKIIEPLLSHLKLEYYDKEAVNNFLVDIYMDYDKKTICIFKFSSKKRITAFYDYVVNELLSNYKKMSVVFKNNGLVEIAKDVGDTLDTRLYYQVVELTDEQEKYLLHNDVLAWGTDYLRNKYNDLAKRYNISNIKAVDYNVLGHTLTLTFIVDWRY